MTWLKKYRIIFTFPKALNKLQLSSKMIIIKMNIHRISYMIFSFYHRIVLFSEKTSYYNRLVRWDTGPAVLTENYY